MLNQDYLKTIHGLISILQIVLGLIAIIIGEIIWTSGSVYIIIFPDSAPGMTFVLFILLLTWAVTLGVTAMQALGKGVLEKMGKFMIMIYHGVILVLLIIAPGVASYYSSRIIISNYGYHTRIVLDTVLLWILVVSHIAQLVFVVLQ